MEIFFRKHIEEFLMGFAVILLGVMIFSFVWGMIYLSENLDSVFEPSSVSGKYDQFQSVGRAEFESERTW